jgi:acetylxylan esterase
MFASVSMLLCAAVASAQLTSKLTEITNFGPNPRNVSMFIYVPANLPANPPILVKTSKYELHVRHTLTPYKVSPHWCHGTAQQGKLRLYEMRVMHTLT